MSSYLVCGGPRNTFQKNGYFKIKQVVELEHHLREKGKCRHFQCVGGVATLSKIWIYFEIQQIIELEHHLREKGKSRLF